MKVRELKDSLALIQGEAKTITAMTSISHWVNKLRADKGYTTENEREISALKKLEGLKIAKLKINKDASVHVELTDDGKELFKDFTAHNYYGG